MNEFYVKKSASIGFRLSCELMRMRSLGRYRGAESLERAVENLIGSPKRSGFREFVAEERIKELGQAEADSK